MELGIHFVNFNLPGQPHTIARALADTARQADEGGVAVFSCMDHWFQMETMASAEHPMLEGYTTLGYLAAVTERLRLGLLVTGVTYRHPGLLAKIVTTLDVLSGGRAQLGIGAAWYEREHRGLGVPFPSVSERFERLEETLQICLQMWSDDDGPFTGRHYQLAETLCRPRPVSTPHPPVLVGGSGERKTLRLVARYADACNLFAPEPSVVARKIDVLKAHCDAEQRDIDSIAVTILAFTDPVNDLPAFLSQAEEYARLGVRTIEVIPLTDDPVGFARHLGARVVPALADMG